MSATEVEILKLRRMIAEVGSSDTYTDEILATYIEAYPLLDERGEIPFTWDTGSSPPEKDDNEDWIPTYDLNAAAADIWVEKASAVSHQVSFSADGGKFDASKKHDQYMANARRYARKKAPTSITAFKFPKERSADSAEDSYILNMPEVD